MVYSIKLSLLEKKQPTEVGYTKSKKIYASKFLSFIL